VDGDHGFIFARARPAVERWGGTSPPDPLSVATERGQLVGVGQGLYQA
jgi:hypothetical protein